MSKLPEGNFTIVNNETGRCVRVRLGESQDVSDWKEGTKYLQTVTDKPALVLADPDGSPATAWWFSTIEDGSERQPFNQFVSFAVDEYQNIGSYCVWLYTDSLAEGEEKRRAQVQFLSRLNDMPADLKKKLAEHIPKEWTALILQRRAERLEAQKKAWAQDGSIGWTEARVEALATEENPLSAEKQAQLRTLWEKVDAGDELTADEATLQKEIMPRYSKIADRAWELLPKAAEPKLKALELEWERTTPKEDLGYWHSLCAFLQFNAPENVRVSGSHAQTGQDKRMAAAMRAYLDAAAKEGIRPQSQAVSARMEMYGCGASRGENRTYRWEYDGTYIYGADSKTVPSERTYWTDDNGYLVGKDKGGPGQKWTLTSWKPAPAEDRDMTPALRTGLFGSITDLFGPITGVFHS